MIERRPTQYHYDGTLFKKIYYVLKHSIPSFVPKPLPSPCCLWPCVVWKKTGRFGQMKLHKADICPTIAIHVSHKAISGVLNRWYWSCLKNALASSPCRDNTYRRASRSSLGTLPHVCLSSVYPDVASYPEYEGNPDVTTYVNKSPKFCPHAFTHHKWSTTGGGKGLGEATVLQVVVYVRVMMGTLRGISSDTSFLLFCFTTLSLAPLSTTQNETPQWSETVCDSATVSVPDHYLIPRPPSHPQDNLGNEITQTFGESQIGSGSYCNYYTVSMYQ